MITPYLRYRLSILRTNATAMQMAAREAGKLWLPHLSGQIPQEVLKVLVHFAHGASCRTVHDSEQLAAAGFQSFILTRPVVDRVALARLAKVAASGKITVVVDHFRQAELLSHAMIAAGTTADILIDVDLGQQTTGVRPGPDSARLAAAVIRLPNVRLRGVFLDDHSTDIYSNEKPPAPDFNQSLAIAQHCQRMIQADKIACEEIVTGQTQFRAAWSASCVSVLLGDPLHFAYHAASSNAAVVADSAVELVSRVLSRPSLEWCVVDVGAADLGAADFGVCKQHPEVKTLRTRPRGASLLRMRTDVSTLTLCGESLDLRIGDEVVIATDSRALRHNLPTLIDE